MSYSYNHGLVTPMKGAVIAAVKITELEVGAGGTAIGADCVIKQAGAGFVSSVEHDATGVYIIKLAAPYPPALLFCDPRISAAATTTDILTARYDSGSYDPATGWLTINVSDDDDSGAPIAADGLDTDELHVLMVFTRYSTLA